MNTEFSNTIIREEAHEASGRGVTDKSAAIRGLVQETHLHPSQLLPLYSLLRERAATDDCEHAGNLPFFPRYSATGGLVLREFGIQAVDLFCYIPNERKDPMARRQFVRAIIYSRHLISSKGSFPTFV